MSFVVAQQSGDALGSTRSTEVEQDRKPSEHSSRLQNEHEWEQFVGLQQVPVPALEPSDAAESAAQVIESRRGLKVSSIRQAWTVARTILLICADMLAANLAGGLARGTRFEAHALPKIVSSVDNSVSVTYLQIGAMIVVAWVVVLACVGAHHKRRFQSLWEQGTAICRATIGMLALVGVTSLFSRLQLSRSYVVTALASLLVLTFVGRCVVYAVFQLFMRVGILADRVLLLGPERQVVEIRRHLERTSHGRVRIVAELTTTDDSTVETDSIVAIAERRGLTSVIVCGQSALPTAALRRLSSVLVGAGISVVVAPGTTEALGPALQIHPIGDLVLLRVANSEPRFVERVGKTLVDRVGALIALTIGAPLLCCVAFFVALEGRPVMFRQSRIGKGGRTFRIFKFRTMAPDAEARLHREGLYERYVANGYKLNADEDPRITRTGRFLRRTSLDELPQLMNVLLGQMSLVGPRPVLAQELASYGDVVGAYTGIKPGLTGYWQINGRSDVGFPERGELDAYYFDHRSLRFDLRIIARTVVTVVLRRGAH